MKVIIAGSRNLGFDALIRALYHCEFTQDITEVVCGGAKGIDKAGKEWAEVCEIPVKMFPAEWDKYGRAAGHLRNEEMAKYADALIAVWDGVSPGTGNMVKNAVKYDLLTFVHTEE
jgi:hypothetical protein